MEKLAGILEEVFEAKLSTDFVKRASYYAEMDYVEYVCRDAICVSERIDEFLTLIWAEDIVVGFKLKGFRYLFENGLKQELELSDADFIPMIKAIEKVFTELGNELFSPEDTSSNKRKKAYEEASKIAVRDNVTINDLADLRTAA